MRNKEVKLLCLILGGALILGAEPLAAQAAVDFGWEQGEDGNWYWYEGGVKQGTEGRGKEIYDPESDAWYWLDSIDGGKRAEAKDVYQDSGAGPYADNEDGTGKWCRYDENGGMVKGWDINGNGTYYFDYHYGAMLKGEHVIDDVQYYFNKDTGIMESCSVGMDNHWANIGGTEYWFEGGIRQGYDSNNPAYRGKEIYDPGSDAWYWLDNVDGGKKAVSKDVYQEYEDGSGKWVRYDAEGRMVKGWQEKDGNRYYFDLTTGAMAKGIVSVEGKAYQFDADTGVCLGEYNADVYTMWMLDKMETFEDGNVIYYEINEYAEKGGYLSRRTLLKSAEFGCEIDEYERDDEGRILHYVYKNQDGKIISENRYAYDSDGNMNEDVFIAYSTLDGEVSIFERTVYEYKDGVCVKECTYAGDNEISAVREYFYNQDGLLTREKVTSYEDNAAGDWEIAGYTEYEYFYDQDGNKVETIWTSSRNGRTFTSREIYEYDQYGNEISKTHYSWSQRQDDWIEGWRTEQTYMYVNDEAYILSQISYDAKGAASYDFQYERNEDGSIKKYTVYSSNNVIYYYEVYGQATPPEEGDSYTNIMERFDKDGKKTSETVYSYSKHTFVK